MRRFRNPSWRGVIGWTLALLLSASVPARSQATTQPRLDFTVLDLKGEPFQAKSLLGQPVLIDFWAVWCAPCVAAFPLLNRLHAERETSGVRVLGVALHSGDVEDIAAFARKHGVEYPMTVGDADLAERFGVIGFPTYFLFAPDGRVHEQYIGKLEEVLDELQSDVAELKRHGAGAVQEGT